MIASASTGSALALEPYRRELRAHCYRLVGSVHDAEELVQETMLRAWKGSSEFDGRSSVRTWVYAICTHVCLDALKARKRRALPPSLRPASDPAEVMPAPGVDPIWIEPFPDADLPDPAPGPEVRYSRRESVTLAFVTALQLLPPRQRAVLLLREVVGFDAVETAAALDMTVAAVNSAVQRARQTLRQQRDLAPPTLIDDVLLQRYVHAWESADVDALVALLRHDVTLSMPPLPLWYAGRDNVMASICAMVFPPGAQWKLRPTRANGNLAFAAYARGEDGAFHARAIQTFCMQGDVITGIVAFLDPSLFGAFGQPALL